MTDKKKEKKLPKNSKCVFKGVIFDVWQWKQKMFDGSYATFEKLSRADTVSIIAIADGKVIVLNQKQPDWKNYQLSLPGGWIDEGETPLQAAKRELLEEAGYNSKEWMLWKQEDPNEKIIWTAHMFIARDCKKKQESHPDAGEKITTKLISFDEFLMISENPDFFEGKLKNALLRARLDPKYRKEFEKLLFGK